MTIKLDESRARIMFYVSASIALLAFAGALIVLAYDGHQLANEATETAREIKGTAVELRSGVAAVKKTARRVNQVSKRGAKYIDGQIDLFESPAYQKSIKASIDFGAHANSVMRSLNKEYLPRLGILLDNGATLLASSNQTVLSLDDFIKRTAGNMDELLPAIRRGIVDVANKTGSSVEAIERAAVTLMEKGGLPLDDLHSIMSDPAWKEALQNFNSSTQHADRIMANLEKGSDSVPDIAKSVQKILKESSRFARAAAILNLLSILARIR